MKFIIHVIATMIVCFILQTFFPWWTMAIGSLSIGYVIGNKGYVSFIAGFTAVGILWATMAFYIDYNTHSILTEKVNRLLPLNSFLISTLIGGLVGAFSALTGSLIKGATK
jgi:hypothetical protein